MSTKRGVRGRTPWPSAGSHGDLREDLAPRQHVTYTCERGHAFEVTFAAKIKVPAAWDCRCGKAAGLGEAPAAGSELQRRMEQVLGRRTRPELEQLLADRLSERIRP